MKWQDHSGFCRWLVRRGYATEGAKGVEPFLSLGCVLYMFEAFTYGLEGGRP